MSINHVSEVQPFTRLGGYTGSTVFHDPQRPWLLGEGFVWLPDGEAVVGSLEPALAAALKAWQQAYDFWRDAEDRVAMAVTRFEDSTDLNDDDVPSTEWLFRTDRRNLRRWRDQEDEARWRFYRLLFQETETTNRPDGQKEA